MAKDPRFNFYPDNWDGGTEDFSLEQEGAYLRLIIMQSRKGRFTPQQALDCLMRKTMGDAAACTKLWIFLMPKFETDGKVYWSGRLEKEVAKSRHHSEKQKERAEERWKKEKGKNGTATAYAKGNATPQALPDNGSGIAIGSEREIKKESPSKIEDDLKTAFDEITVENLVMSKAYPGVDIHAQLKQFHLKVRLSPRVYADHGTEGLRLAFNTQLRSVTPTTEKKPRETGSEFLKRAVK